MAGNRASKIQSIGEASTPAWLPNGRLRRAVPPPRVAPEILLRSPLFLVQPVFLVQPARQSAAAAAVPTPSAPRLPAQIILFPAIQPDAAKATLWRTQDKYYALLLIGLATLAWWGPF